MKIVVDKEDVDRIAKFKWHDSGSSIYRYAESGKTISVAQEVMQIYDIRFDHRNRDYFFNKKSNLRPATQLQNSWNSSKGYGTSKYKGVHWRKNRKRWIASITVNGKLLYLGSFRYEINAALAYDRAARKYFGEFANCNFYIT